MAPPRKYLEPRRRIVIQLPLRVYEEFARMYPHHGMLNRVGAQLFANHIKRMATKADKILESEPLEPSRPSESSEPSELPNG